MRKELYSIIAGTAMLAGCSTNLKTNTLSMSSSREVKNLGSYSIDEVRINNRMYRAIPFTDQNKTAFINNVEYPRNMLENIILVPSDKSNTSISRSNGVNVSPTNELYVLVNARYENGELVPNSTGKLESATIDYGIVNPLSGKTTSTGPFTQRIVYERTETDLYKLNLNNKEFFAFYDSTPQEGQLNVVLVKKEGSILSLNEREGKLFKSIEGAWYIPIGGEIINVTPKNTANDKKEENTHLFEIIRVNPPSKKEKE